MADTLGTWNKINWSSQQEKDNLQLTATTHNLQSITLPNITNATIQLARLKFRAQSYRRDTTGSLIITVQIKKGAGSWTDAITFVDTAMPVPANDNTKVYELQGHLDISSIVDVFNQTYDIRLNVSSVSTNIYLYLYWSELEVYFTVDSGVEAKIDTIDTEVGVIDGNVDDILTDTADMQPRVVAIETDTNEIQGKLPTNKFMGSSDVNDHDTDIDAIKTETDKLFSSAMGALTGGSFADDLMNKDGSQTYDPTTDSLEAIRDRGDAAWAGTGATKEQIAQAVWEEDIDGSHTGDQAGKVLYDVEQGVVAIEVDTQDIQSRIPASLVGGRTRSHTEAQDDLALTAQQKLDVNTECDTALTDYDPPTRTEATDDKNEIIVEVDANETKIDAVLVDTGTTLPTQISTHDTDIKAGLATNLAAITSIQNNTRFTSAVPESMQKPDSSSTAFRWVGNLYDTDGNMEDPDDSEILIRVLQADGTPITANMYKEQALSNLLDNATNQVDFPSGSGWRAMERLGVGQYDLFYKVASTETEESLTIEFGWDLNSSILKQNRSTEVTDAKGDIEDIQTKVDAMYIKTDAGTPSPTIPAQITTHDTDIKALPNAQSTPEYLTIPSGITRINVEGGVDNAVTTIPIYDTTVLGEDGVAVVVLIGTEYVTGTIDSSNSQLVSCTRGAYSSTPAAHADVVAVYEVNIYPLRLNLFDGELNMVTPDSAPTIEIVDWANVQEIAPTAMTVISTGLYGYNYFLVAGSVPEPKTIRYSITINSITTLRHSTLMVLDRPASVIEMTNLVGGGTGEFYVNQDGYLDSSNIFQLWTDVMKGFLRDATTGSRLNNVLVTAYKVVNGVTILAIIPPGQAVCDNNGNYEMRLDAGTYVFKFYKDQYRFPTDEVTRAVTS